MIREVNLVVKKLRKGMVRIAILYPSTYSASLSSLAIHSIYYIANSYPEVYAERFTADNSRSLETRSPLKDFDYIISSIHYELDYPKLVSILNKGGVSVLRNSRRSKPLLIVGGPTPMSNPAPLIDIVDAIAVGEVEVLLPTLIEAIIENHGEPSRILEVLPSNGFYIPELGEEARRLWTNDLNTAFYPVKQIQSLSNEPVYGKGFIIETSRGCPRWCRFCIEGRLFKPHRVRSFQTLVKLVEEGLRVNEVSRVIVYSLFYPGSSGELHMLKYLSNRGIKASVPSIRLDLLSDEVLELIHGVGQRTLVAAPENVSSYGEAVLCKFFKRKDHEVTLKQAVDKGFDLKLYFIAGIKGEDFDSIRENVEFIRRISSYARKSGRKISISINPLIPKPKTPFQWIGMIDVARAKKIIKYMKEELGEVVDVRPYDAEYAWAQASIALGDSRLSKLIVEWGLSGGGVSSWKRILNSYGYSTTYVTTGRRFGEKMPWDDIIIGEYVEEAVKAEYIALRKIIKETEVTNS
ncbi:MAG: radical SAM protein [Sulfolobales archaeon]|nr:radical SAM protein [Sulfolobales archaeon]